MAVDFKLNKTADQIIKDSGINDGALLFAANEARTLMNDFVPMKTGALADSVQTFVEEGRGVVNYTQNYAAVCYYGDNRNFSRDRHEKASAYWDRAMISANKGVLTGKVNDYIKNRGS